MILEGVSLGSLDIPNFAPLTGYISFFALALYVTGLIGLSFSFDQIAAPVADEPLLLPEKNSVLSPRFY